MVNLYLNILGKLNLYSYLTIFCWIRLQEFYLFNFRRSQHDFWLWNETWRVLKIIRSYDWWVVINQKCHVADLPLSVWIETNWPGHKSLFRLQVIFSVNENPSWSHTKTRNDSHHCKTFKLNLLIVFHRFSY